MSKIFAIGGAGFATSTDGVSWSYSASPFDPSAVVALAYGNGIFVAGGGTSNSGGMIATSPDGVTWTSQDGSWSPEGINAIAFDGSQFLAAASGGYLATSPDGVTWTARSLGFSFYNADTITYAFGSGLHVVGGNNGSLATSPDTIIWTERSSGFSGPDPTSDHINAAAFGNGLFVIAGDFGQLATSPDGITWTLRTSGFGSDPIISLTFANGLFLAAGGSGKVRTSTDGITWTARSAGLSGTIRAAVNGYGLFIVVGNSGQLATSPDGVTWTSRTSGFGAGSILCAFSLPYVLATASPSLGAFTTTLTASISLPTIGAVAALQIPPFATAISAFLSPPLNVPGGDGLDHWLQRGGADYARAWTDLLPTGPAWPRDPQSVLQTVISGLAQIWGDQVEVLAARLLTIESDPRQTVTLLPDWERAWGLPDDCVAEPVTIADRQNVLVAKMTLLGAQSRAFMTAQAAREGYTITIKEFAPFMCGVSRAGDTTAQNPDNDGSPRWQIGPPEMRFYWTTGVGQARLSWFRAGSGQAGVDPHLRIGIATDLDCLLTRIKPAHTQIVFDYSGLVSGGPLAGTP